LEMTDADIIAECLSGRTESFAQLVARYRRLVYNVIFNYTGTREDSDDLFQEVFIRIYQSLGTYDAAFRFSTWAIRIAVNACCDWRKKRRETLPIESAAEVGDVRPGPEEQYLAEELTESVLEAVRDLPDMYRLPVQLFHQQGLSYREIAEVLKQPESIVKNRLYRARLMLAGILNVDGAP
jgi:RNA polymerase sigma factor (sigma-70 family)